MPARTAEVLVLGSGTSTGVPLIGCTCPVCTSSDPRDVRARCGLHVSCDGFALQIDVSPDFRAQALRLGVSRVDAALVTHCHADHALGLDDLRRFNTLQGAPIPLYARRTAMRGLRRIFGYVFEPSAAARRSRLYLPRLVPHEIGDAPVAIGPFLVRTLRIPHGPSFSCAVEVALDGRRLVVASDCSRVTPPLAAMLRGADLAFLDGLRDRPHSAHLTVDAAAAALLASGCRRGRLIHIGHDILHADLLRRLPAPLAPSFDGERLPL